MEKILFTWWNLQRYLKSEKGQGMVEYALILGLVAVACIAGMTNIGGAVVTKINTVIHGLGGTEVSVPSAPPAKS